MKPPAVYQPCPAREVVQGKMNAVQAAPAVYNPCPPKKAVQGKMALLSRAVVQRAKQGKVELTPAQHNWEVIVAYSRDMASEIEDAFYAAGYNVNNALDAIIAVIEGSPWANKKLAHIKGKSTSKKRGGTDKAILDLKKYILENVH